MVQSLQDPKHLGTSGVYTVSSTSMDTELWVMEETSISHSYAV